MSLPVVAETHDLAILDVGDFEDLGVAKDDIVNFSDEASASRLRQITPQLIIDKIREASGNDRNVAVIRLDGYVSPSSDDYKALKKALLKNDIITDICMFNSSSDYTLGWLENAETLTEFNEEYSSPSEEDHEFGEKPDFYLAINIKNKRDLTQPLKQEKQKTSGLFGFLRRSKPQGIAQDVPQVVDDSLDMGARLDSLAKNIARRANVFNGLDVNVGDLTQAVDRIKQALGNDEGLKRLPPVRVAKARLQALDETFQSHAKLPDLKPEEIGELKESFDLMVQYLNKTADRASSPMRVRADVERAVLSSQLRRDL